MAVPMSQSQVVAGGLGDLSGVYGRRALVAVIVVPFVVLATVSAFRRTPTIEEPEAWKRYPKIDGAGSTSSTATAPECTFWNTPAEDERVSFRIFSGRAP